jgi:hypothetical protein
LISWLLPAEAAAAVVMVEAAEPVDFVLPLRTLAVAVRWNLLWQ